MSRPLFRVGLGALAIGSLVGGTFALGGGGAAADPVTAPVTFAAPGVFDFTVPDGVTMLSIEARGAQGGNGFETTGGLGGLFAADVPVTPGSTLKVHVGGAGTSDGAGAAGGANGGGATPSSECGDVAGSGGGASDVRTSDDGLEDRLIVAGGGGGGSTYFNNGGDGGGSAPSDGAGAMIGGTAGSSAEGGGGGGSDAGEPAGQNGALGAGGDAVLTSGGGCGMSGGGGGGYYGGGSGGISSDGGGGGGGSAFAIAGADVTADASGVEEGDGQVTISWVTPATTTTTTTTTEAPTTTTTTVPTTPKPSAPACPSPVVPNRVWGNTFSLTVTKYLVDNCGATTRSTTAAGQSVWVLDPPSTSACPSWRAVRVVLSRDSLLIAQHLMNNCGFTVRLQREGKSGAVYVVPDGYPAGRVTV